MSKVKGKLYFDKKQLTEYFINFVEEMKEQGLPESEIDRRVAKHYTNTVIRKYSAKEEDLNWNELYNTIMNVDGGYWQIVDNMDYMPQFEHRRFKCLRSIYGKK